MDVRKATYKELGIGEIRPSGWLEAQLRLQLEGLTGNLDKFWPYVKDSQWFGGQSEGWERAPYWLDGALPLAHILGDEELIARTDGYLDYIVEHQGEDGWLGPRDMKSELASTGANADYDLWAQFLALKVLVQYHDITGKDAALRAIGRSLRCIERHIDRYPLFNWAQFRWFEALIPILWYYEKTREPWLLDLAVKLKAQGFDWKGFFESWPCSKAGEKGAWSYMSHAVNNAMALKAYALWHRISGAREDLDAVDTMIARLDECHGAAVGIFTGDECLAGTGAIQGTELCAVVEYMYSLEEIVKSSGDLTRFDRLESIAFNALPATISEDMWSHQYDQQANQIQCSVREDWPWITNRSDANTFGLEPDFGCCTANMHQGWPKFARNLWYEDGDGDLIAASYVPCRIEKRVKGESVSIVVEGEYPFGERVRIEVANPGRARFELGLRIPSWSSGTRILRNGAEVAVTGNLAWLSVSGERESIVVEFEARAEILPRNERYFSVRRGPLVFALGLDCEWRPIHEGVAGREPPHGDWEVYPRSPWNYSFAPGALAVERRGIGPVPFSGKAPPLRMAVKGVEIRNWKAAGGSVGELPERLELGEARDLVLVPYGCARLRITEFPRI